MNDIVDPSFQIQDWNLINYSVDGPEAPMVADILGVIETEFPQDHTTFNQIEANDQNDYNIFSTANQQETQNLVATTSNESDSSISVNNLQSQTLPMGSIEGLNGVIRSSINDVHDPAPTRTIDTFKPKKSIYRGVTRHKVTRRYDVHLWDNTSRTQGKSRKGRLVYLGGYDDEDDAARAYDLGALKYWGTSTPINFPLSNYEMELEEMEQMSRQEFVASLRRKSSAFSRGRSIYRGVTKHHQPGKWAAKLGRGIAGDKELFLGTYSTEEEAAKAYDIATIKFRGLNAVTNFNINQYDIPCILRNEKLPIRGRAAKRVLKATKIRDGTNDRSSIFYTSGSTSNLQGSLMPTFEQPQPLLALQTQENSQYTEGTKFHQNFIDDQNQLPDPTPFLLNSNQESQFNQNPIDALNQLSDPTPLLLNPSQESHFNQNLIDDQNQLPDPTPFLLNSIQESQFNQNFIDSQNQLPDPTPLLHNSSQESQFNQNFIDALNQLADPNPFLLNSIQESEFNQNFIDAQNQLADPTHLILNSCQESQFNQNFNDAQNQFPNPTPLLLNSSQEYQFNENCFLNDMMNMGQSSLSIMENNGSSNTNYNGGYLVNELTLAANSNSANSTGMGSLSDLGLVTSDYNINTGGYNDWSFEAIDQESSIPLSPLWNDIDRL
ncbi:AP2-like ethylene-responsive transcription factor PLT1 [Telopea speciosissima]|uniref:AP2-like ethylene-responsive transcription factor PLT1 n=1 Tax=Telopea speciosissima TaxID=54955 RepID=UPI001CC538CE|nr:AP2-like ethylene-responsive transcription factor PLT1 [Telopea speciosissima]